METAGKKIRAAMYCRMGTDTESKQGQERQEGWRIPQCNPPADYRKMVQVFEHRRTI